MSHYYAVISDETRARIAAHLASLPPYVPPPPLQPGEIQLDSNPDNAPCCIRIEAHGGRDLLIQTDWDWPGVASTFGWRIADCKPEAPDGFYLWQEGRDTFGGEHWTAEDLKAFANFEAFSCEHDGTDGTIDCPACGMKAGRFLQLAREWLDQNDGAITKDPGYFD